MRTLKIGSRPGSPAHISTDNNKYGESAIVDGQRAPLDQRNPEGGTDMASYTVSGGQTSSGITLSSGDSLTVMSGGTVDGGTIAAVYGAGGPATVTNLYGGLISGGTGATGASGSPCGGAGGNGAAGIDLTGGGTISNSGI